MTALTGRTLDATYKDLLQVSNVNTGLDTTLRSLEDGDGTASEAVKFAVKALQINGAIYATLTGDGATDNASALATWMTAAGAGGAVVVDKPGTYVMTTLHTTGRIRVLSGPGVVWKIKAGHNDHMVYIDHDGCAFEGGTWDGNKGNVVGSLRLFYGNNRADTLYRDCLMQNVAGHAIHQDDGARTRVLACRFVNTGDTAVQFYSKTTAHVADCLVFGCFFDRTANGADPGGCAKFSYSTGGEIRNCKILACDAKMATNPSGADQVAFEIWGPGRGGLIEGVTVEGGSIGASIANQHQHGAITNSSFRNCADIAGELADVDYCALVNNRCFGNGNTGSAWNIDGTNHGADYCAVVGNQSEGTTDRAIFVWTNATNWTVEGNTARHTGATDAIVQVEGNCHDGIIAGNLFNGGGAASVGIVVRNCNRVAIGPNRIRSVTSQRVQVVANNQAVDYITINGVHGDGTGGIQFVTSGTGSFGDNCSGSDLGDYAPYGIQNPTIERMKADVTLWVYANGYYAGSPESAVDAGIGSLLRSTNGNVYRKSTNGGNTGWVAV